MMDKAELLELLAKARAHADKAHLDVVMHSHVDAAAQVADACAVHLHLKDAENAEQKHIREITWLLDQLDKLDR